jgi:hypothetical protein
MKHTDLNWNEAMERFEKQKAELAEKYKHPELKDDEILLINIKPGEEAQFTTNIPDFIESVRIGEVAYKTHSWDVSEGYKPLFGKLKTKS